VVTADRPRKHGRLSGRRQGQASAELASLEQMAQISAEFPALGWRERRPA
jgi:hypothetical protein